MLQNRQNEYSKLFDKSYLFTNLRSIPSVIKYKQQYAKYGIQNSNSRERTQNSVQFANQQNASQMSKYLVIPIVLQGQQQLPFQSHNQFPSYAPIIYHNQQHPLQQELVSQIQGYQTYQKGTVYSTIKLQGITLQQYKVKVLAQEQELFTEQQAWGFLNSVTESLVQINQRYGIQHPHLTDQTIRILQTNKPSNLHNTSQYLALSSKQIMASSTQQFKVVFHPLIKSAVSCLLENRTSRSEDSYYISPQERYYLRKAMHSAASHNQHVQITLSSNTNVFKAGLIILDLMLPKDQYISIFQKNNQIYINNQAFKAKIRKIQRFYSEELVAIVKKCLEFKSNLRFKDVQQLKTSVNQAEGIILQKKRMLLSRMVRNKNIQHLGFQIKINQQAVNQFKQSPRKSINRNSQLLNSYQNLQRSEPQQNHYRYSQLPKKLPLYQFNKMPEANILEPKSVKIKQPQYVENNSSQIVLNATSQQQNSALKAQKQLDQAMKSSRNQRKIQTPYLNNFHSNEVHSEYQQVDSQYSQQNDKGQGYQDELSNAVDQQFIPEQLALDKNSLSVKEQNYNENQYYHQFVNPSDSKKQHNFLKKKQRSQNIDQISQDQTKQHEQISDKVDKPTQQTQNQVQTHRISKGKQNQQEEQSGNQERLDNHRYTFNPHHYRSKSPQKQQQTGFHQTRRHESRQEYNQTAKKSKIKNNKKKSSKGNKQKNFNQNSYENDQKHPASGYFSPDKHIQLVHYRAQPSYYRAYPSYDRTYQQKIKTSKNLPKNQEIYAVNEFSSIRQASDRQFSNFDFPQTQYQRRMSPNSQNQNCNDSTNQNYIKAVKKPKPSSKKTQKISKHNGTPQKYKQKGKSKGIQLSSQKINGPTHSSSERILLSKYKNQSNYLEQSRNSHKQKHKTFDICPFSQKWQNIRPSSLQSQKRYESQYSPKKKYIQTSNQFLNQKQKNEQSQFYQSQQKQMPIYDRNNPYLQYQVQNLRNKNLYHQKQVKTNIKYSNQIIPAFRENRNEGDQSTSADYFNVNQQQGKLAHHKNAFSKIIAQIHSQNQILMEFPTFKTAQCTVPQLIPHSLPQCNPNRDVRILNINLFIFSQNSQNCLLALQKIIKQVTGIQNGVWIEGNLYYGQMKNGRRNGLGLQIFSNSNSEYYFGYFIGDLFHGQGFYHWASKDYFLGIFQAGQKNKGYLHGCDRFQYMGGIKNGKREGYGYCWYSDGSFYKGFFKDGKKHGKQQVIIEPTGDLFIGQFYKNKRRGYGVFYSQTTQIRGVWRGDDTIEGQAKVIEKIPGSGNEIRSIYTGELQPQTFKMSGQGQYIFVSSSTCAKFIGQFKDNKPVRGRVQYRDGGRYSGQLKDMKKNGYGQYYYPDGSCYRGVWIDDKKMGKPTKPA